MSAMFGPRRRLRRFALQALLVWLFALGSGVVNACLVETDVQVGAAVAAHDHGTPAGEPVAPHADKTACAKFCDADSALRLNSAQKSDAAGTIALAPPPSVLAFARAMPGRGCSARIETAPPFARTPIPIAFLRLAL